MEFLEAFEGPVVEKIGGVDIKFAALEIDDYSPWIAELTTERKAAARKLLPVNGGFDPQTRQQIAIDPDTQFKLRQRIETMELSLEAIGNKVWTVPGAKRILDMSLTKAGYSEDDRNQIIKRVKPVRLHMLAMEVSQLFERNPTPSTTAIVGNVDPNSPSPAPGDESSVAGGAIG